MKQMKLPPPSLACCLPCLSQKNHTWEGCQIIVSGYPMSMLLWGGNLVHVNTLVALKCLGMSHATWKD